MVSLSLMARLVEAVRPDARLVLVGDPGQLASIEAGAVLGDVVGPAADQLLIVARRRATQLADVTGAGHRRSRPTGRSTIGDGIVVLDRVHRFGGGIARLADAIRRGDADAALEALETRPTDVQWIPVGHRRGAARSCPRADPRGDPWPPREPSSRRPEPATRPQRSRGSASYRLLCAHRRGPYGVATWTARIEGWLAAEVDGFGADAAGTSAARSS